MANKNKRVRYEYMMCDINDIFEHLPGGWRKYGEYIRVGKTKMARLRKKVVKDEKENE